MIQQQQHEGCFFLFFLKRAFDIPLWLPEDRLDALRLDGCDNGDSNIDYVSCYWDVEQEQRLAGGDYKKKKQLIYFLTSVLFLVHENTVHNPHFQQLWALCSRHRT